MRPTPWLTASALLLVGCFGSSEPAKAPAVDEAHTFAHPDESSTDEEPVDTSLTLEKDTWIKLTGYWYTTTDRDRFNVAVGEGVNAYEAQTWLIREGKSEPEIFEGLLGMNIYPLTLVMKDAEGKVLTNQLKAASGGGGRLKPGTASLVVQVASNDPPDPSSFGDPPSLCCGNQWIVYLKGTYREPRKDKGATPEAGEKPAEGAKPEAAGKPEAGQKPEAGEKPAEGAP